MPNAVIQTTERITLGIRDIMVAIIHIVFADKIFSVESYKRNVLSVVPTYIKYHWYTILLGHKHYYVTG